MAEIKSPFAAAIPVILPLATLGGVLGYLIESGKVPLGPVAGAMAVGFGLLGAFLAYQGQLLRRLSTSMDQQQNVQTDLAKQVSDAVISAQAGLADQLKGSEKSLKTVSDAMTGIAAQVTQAYGGGADKLASVLQGHKDDMNKMGVLWADQIHGVFEQHQKMVQSAVNAMNAAGEDWRTKLLGGLKEQFERVETNLTAIVDKGESLRDKLLSGMQDHVTSLSTSSRLLTDAVNRLGALGQDIEKLLHVQKAVDSTLETISKTEEFKKTISRLSDHLAESDRLLREVSKPKTIRLVEQAMDG